MLGAGAARRYLSEAWLSALVSLKLSPPAPRSIARPPQAPTASPTVYVRAVACLRVCPGSVVALITNSRPGVMTWCQWNTAPWRAATLPSPAVTADRTDLVVTSGGSGAVCSSQKPDMSEQTRDTRSQRVGATGELHVGAKTPHQCGSRRGDEGYPLH